MDNAVLETKESLPGNYKFNLMLLMMGRIVSSLGTSAFNFALSLYVLDLTKSSVAFSTLLSFSIIPGILVNILAGVYIDTHNKKKILITSELLCGAAVIIFMLLFSSYPKSFFLLIVYVIVLNILQSFFSLALNASIPEIVGKSMVPKTNSAFQGLSAVVNITGPIAGAILYKHISMESIFLADGVTFMIAGTATCFIVFSKSGNEEKNSNTFFENVKEVFSYINTQPVLRFLFTVAITLNTILYPMLFVVISFIAYNILGLTSYQLSLIQSAIAAGTILGAAFVITRKSTGPIMKRFFVLLKAQAILICLWVFPVLPFFNGATKTVITLVYILLVLLYTMMNTIQNIPLITHFQVNVPENLRGRLFGVFFTALNISTPIGIWIYGLLLSNVYWIFIPVVSGLIVFIICIFQSRNKYFREFIKEL
ncbi:MAG: MFS transporter [Clostridia bacterium]|nr:MFS transporter [Clostridia bacterium]